MKLLPPPSYARKAMRSDDSLGRAMEAAFTILGFFGIGFALDRWLGTTPVFMIVCTVLAAVGLFYAWKARYMAHMEALEHQRRVLTARPTIASERAPASERPDAACVAGERNERPASERPDADCVAGERHERPASERPQAACVAGER
jgi:hypothetical protein